MNKYHIIQNKINTEQFAEHITAFFETHDIIDFQVTPETSESYEKIHIQYEEMA